MRPLHRVPVPPGHAGIGALLGPLHAAVTGDGPAIAPVPVATATVSQAYVGMVLAATRPDDPHAPLDDDETALVVSTSGSTGRPRGVRLTGPALTALTSAVVVDGDPQWIAALPLTSMGGLNVLVRALATSREPIGLPSVSSRKVRVPGR